MKQKRQKEITKKMLGLDVGAGVKSCLRATGGGWWGGRSLLLLLSRSGWKVWWWVIFLTASHGEVLEDGGQYSQININKKYEERKKGGGQRKEDKIKSN